MIVNALMKHLHLSIRFIKLQKKIYQMQTYLIMFLKLKT
jgi:hypothetical protein